MKRISKGISIRLLLLSVLVLPLASRVQAQDLKTALKLTQSERFEEAENMYETVIKNNPGNGDAYYYYGVDLFKSYYSDTLSSTLKEVVTKAKELFEKGYAADSVNKLNVIGLGIITLVSTGDTVAADRFFNRVKGFPKNKKKYTDVHINLLIQLGQAQVYGKTPRFKKAIAILEQAEDIAPNNALIYNALGDVYLKMTDATAASSAIQKYNRAHFLDPTNPVYMVKIGTIYMWSKNLQEAKSNFESAQEIDSTYAPVYEELGAMWNMAGQFKLSKDNYKKYLDLCQNNIPAMIKYANSLFKAKDYGEAYRVITEVLKSDNSRNYLNRLAAYTAYDKKGDNKLEDYESALKYMDTFFANAPADKIIPKDYLYLGKILIGLNPLRKTNIDTLQVDRGLLNFKKAYDADTSKQELFANIITNAYNYKRFKLAAEFLNEKIQKGNSSGSDLFMLGKVYYQMNEYGKADSTFLTIIQKEPDNIQAYSWRANANASMDPDSKLGLAKPFYEKVVEKAQVDTVKNLKALCEAYSYLGAYYLTNTKPIDFENAEKAFQKLINIDPNNKSSQIKGYAGLAQIAGKKKDNVKARAYYEKLATLDPSNEDFKKAAKAYDRIIKAQQENQ